MGLKQQRFNRKQRRANRRMRKLVEMHDRLEKEGIRLDILRDHIHRLERDLYYMRGVQKVFAKLRLWRMDATRRKRYIRLEKGYKRYRKLDNKWRRV